MHRSLPKLCLSLSVAAVASAGLSATAHAQGDNGFLRGEGKTDISFNYSYEKFSRFWVGDDKVHDPAIGKVYRESYNFWAAYGLRDDLDLVAQASIVRADTTGNPRMRDHSALQDGVFGAKWRVFDQRLGPGSFTIAATPAVKIPLSHYEANAVTALGDGQIDFRFRGVAQYQLDCGAYLAVETGYDVRMGGTPNQYPINVSLGATVFDRLTVTPFIEYMNSEGSDDIGQVDFPDVEEDYYRWGIGTYLRLNEHIGVTAGYKATIDGKNTGDSWSYWAGIVFKI
jgi:hypothetical protein